MIVANIILSIALIILLGMFAVVTLTWGSKAVEQDKEVEKDWSDRAWTEDCLAEDGGKLGAEFEKEVDNAMDEFAYLPYKYRTIVAHATALERMKNKSEVQK